MKYHFKAPEQQQQQQQHTFIDLSHDKHICDQNMYVIG